MDKERQSRVVVSRVRGRDVGVGVGRQRWVWGGGVWGGWLFWGGGGGAPEMGAGAGREDGRWGDVVWCSVVHMYKSQHSEEGVYLQFEISLGY